MAGTGTRLVMLGTSGGPLPSPVRSGIAQALVVDGRTFLVDCGTGVVRQLRRAKLLSSLRGVFLTHLHSDHDCDYFNLFLLGWPVLQWNPPVHVYGPGPAGGAAALPECDPSHDMALVNPDNPTPGLADMTLSLLHAHAYDINVRMRDSGRADLSELIVAHELCVTGTGAWAPGLVAPAMEPMAVAEDDGVRVSAVLVPHGPVFPSFAFRFETPDGSVVVSGDTAPSENVVTLARGADVLVHEVFSDDDDDRHEAGTWEAEQRRRHLLTSHTPLSQVGRIAARAGVGRLVLTHFIPGDDGLPDDYWIRRVQDFDGEVIVARDLMELELRI